MKREKKKKISITAKRIRIDQVYEDAPHALKILESSWNNLPTDLSLEEREIFYELSSELIKANNKIRRILNIDNDLKN